MPKKLMVMGAADLGFVVAAARVNREDCKRTKHDSQFYKWQVLVGPSDWEDHSLGKEGAARYRVHNLPTVTSPGLYELGVAVSPTAKIHSDDVVVVYLGQADNVRTRLQRYGRSGAHLNNPNYSALKRGPGLFEDIFSRGYSIVFRWVPMKSKADALKMEAQLLDIFDYAWNKGSNGARRHDDVLRKLDRAPSRNIQFPKFVRKFLHYSQKPVGIKIKETNILFPGQKCNNHADKTSNKFFPQVFKFSRSQPKLVFDGQGAEDRHLIIKGYISKLNRGAKIQVESADSESSISSSREVDHHGALSSLFDPVKLPVVAAEKCPISEGYTKTCGDVLDDNSLCIKQPVQGHKRRNENKWRKTYGSDSKSRGTSHSVAEAAYDSCDRKALNYDQKNSPEIYRAGRIFSSKSSEVNLHYDNICGVELGDGYLRTSQPVKCEEDEGLRVNGNLSRSDEKDETSEYGEDLKSSTFHDRECSSSVCGAKMVSGSYCTRPIKGNTSCWQHSARISYRDSTISSSNDRKYGGTSLCGARTQNSSCCTRKVKGGGRCWQHSGQVQEHRGNGLLPSLSLSDRDSTISSRSDWKYGVTSLCGAPTRNGSSCKRKVKGGGRCWQH